MTNRIKIRQDPDANLTSLGEEKGSEEMQIEAGLTRDMTIRTRMDTFYT